MSCYTRGVNELEEYKKLLESVASGSGDILGYSNLEKKLGPEYRAIIIEYRDSIVEKDRIDRFIVPNTESNIDLVEDHFSKTQWAQHMLARFIDTGTFNVPCDLYVWDNKVGIAFFQEGALSVSIYDDQVLHDLLKKSLDLLWGISLDKVHYFGPRTSDLTRAEKETYLSEKEVLDMGVGYPQGVSPDWVIDHVADIPRDEFLATSPRVLIQKIQDYFLGIFGAKNIQLTPSSTYAFLVAVDVLIETPGDEVIVLDPGYDSYPNIIRSFGGNVIYSPRGTNDAENLENLASRVSGRTVAIVLCSPDNPSGEVFSRGFLDQVVDMCTKHNITLVLDQTFFQINLSGGATPSVSDTTPAELSYVVIGDTGKVLGLDGTKLGALMFSPNLAAAVEDKTNVYFFELNKYDLFVLAKILHDQRFGGYLESLRESVLQNLAYIKENVSPLVLVETPAGSSVCMLDIRGTGLSDVEFVALMQKNGLALIPCSYFYSGVSEISHDYVRIALARPFEDVQKAVAIINSMIGGDFSGF